MTADELRHRLLDWRGVADPCLRCAGAGNVTYGNGSTWRGGMGAAASTLDVCDACWGTGDRYRHGVNLRQLRDEDDKRVADRAIRALEDATGAGHRGRDTIDLMLEFDKILDRRKPPPSLFVSSMLLSIRNLIARSLGAQERKL